MSKYNLTEELEGIRATYEADTPQAGMVDLLKSRVALEVEETIIDKFPV